MYEFAGKYIRKAAQEGRLSFSRHALERMTEREIEIWQVKECAIKGNIIETQDHDKDIKVLFQEAKKNCPEFYSVISATFPEVLVVSVCRFKEEAWEYINGLMRRRRENG